MSTPKYHVCDAKPDALQIYQMFSTSGDKDYYLNLACIRKPRGKDEKVMAGAAVSFHVRFCPFCGEELK